MSKAKEDPRILRGMKQQLEQRQARLRAGEKPLGWKVGFGAPAGLERFNIDAPLVGFMTDKTVLTLTDTPSIAGWVKPIAEPEIAVYMGSDLGPGSDRKAAQAAIAAIGPVVELADVHFPPEDVEQILAGNIYHRHIIFGRADSSRAGCVLEGLVGLVYHNGRKIAETAAMQALTGDTVSIVQHVADLLPVFGEKLRAGELIITGSIVPPITIQGGDEIRFTLKPIDTITLNIAV